MASAFWKKAGRVAVGIAAMLAAGTVVTAPQQAQAFDVYTTPGTHNINGRQWRTSCSMYSSTVERCTTNIYATQVAYRGGRWVQSNGWVFNNLTYKPNPRSVWKGNPIATPGYHTVQGRKWYTECDTKWTGGNACRSMIEATVPEARNGTYVMVKKYVFNNIVHFTPSSAPKPQPTKPPTTRPTDPPKPQQRWYYLSELDETSYTDDWYRTGSAQIGSRTFPKSLYDNDGTNYSAQPAQHNYALGRQCTKFEAYPGPMTTSVNSGAVTFYFYVNGDRVQERVVPTRTEPTIMSVDITNAFDISVGSLSPKAGGHAAWGDARVLCYEEPQTQS